LADVVLDPPHYSAGFTAYDAFSLGLPVVTLPGEFHVGRYTFGCYRKMGLEQLAALDAEQYVTTAIRVAGDADYRTDVRDQIARQSGLLFEDSSVVLEYERVFDQLIAQNSDG
jgi:predicted O-linked N-acetylglucosamine transferase (SPINDLY family)